MTESRKERLYNLLPSVYRAHDTKEGEPLRALLELIEGQMLQLEEDIEGLYEDWFIETCDDWVIPYIGDLLGVHAIHSFSENGASTRGYVANTIAYRRRKGTASILEQVCRDVTGWNAHAVEFFQLLAVTQNLNHLRLDRGQTACVRDADGIELVGGPFETTAHTLGVRGIESLAGKYNIPNVGIFLWRLQSYPLRQASARKRSGKNCYTFDPTGLDIPLFNRPQTEKLIVHLSEEVNVPGPLRRYPLYAELEGRRKGSAPKLSYFDPEPVFGIYIVPEVASEPLKVPEEDVFICNMADEWHYPPSLAEKEIIWLSDFRFEVEENGGMVNDRSFFAGELVELFSDQRNNPGVFAAIKKAEKSDSRWMLTADRDISIFSTHTNRRARKLTVAVDPERGRLTIPKAASPESVLVDYYYGFSADVGAGPYDRTSSIQQSFGPKVDWQIGVSKKAYEGDKICNTVQEALNKWSNPENGGVSGMYFRWGEIPGKDNEKLIEILAQKFDINWIKTAVIKKINGDKTIFVSAEERCLSIKLNDEKTEAILEINDGRTDKLKTRLVEGELVVCSGIKMGLIVLMDSRTYSEESLNVTVPNGCKLLIAAADWPQPGSIGQFVPRGLRPHIYADIVLKSPEEGSSDSGTDPGELIIDGLLVEGKLSVTAGNLRLQVAHATMVPAFGGIKIEENSSVELTIDRSICGPISIASKSSSLILNESIIDTGMSGGGGTIVAEDATASIDRCTILGKSRLRRLEASNSIFAEEVAVKQRQKGCVRFSYLSPDSLSPRRFHCQPDIALAAAREEYGAALSEEERIAIKNRCSPVFTSIHYGDPGYLQLSFESAREIRTGAEDGSEMGVFGILQQPQREANLRTALEEYLRFGLEAGIFFVT